MAKEFGVATYVAMKVTEALVLITAHGTAPNWNTRVTLEQLPWRIWPPRFGLYFDTPDIALPALRPFTVSSLFAYPASLGQVTIIDAAGQHEVKIGSAIDAGRSRRGQGQCRARRSTPTSRSACANCMIAPVDAMVPMIFRKAHGPDTYKGCEDWIAKNCGKA